jgi:hypothetical protein
VESGQRAAIEVLLALGLPVAHSIAALPYSRVPGEHIGAGTPRTPLEQAKTAARTAPVLRSRA